MKNAIILLTGAVILLCGAVSVQHSRLMKIKEERDIQLYNRDVLLTEAVACYKVADSLSAVSARELILTRKEFERYRSETAAIVERLKADKRGLESVSSVQARTIYDLQSLPVKTIRDTIYMPGTDARVIEYMDKWLDLQVRLYADDTADVDICNREELIYTEWVKRRKFLWFRFGAKERRQEIISLNPNTEITNSEFITIKQ